MDNNEEKNVQPRENSLYENPQKVRIQMVDTTKNSHIRILDDDELIQTDVRKTPKKRSFTVTRTQFIVIVLLAIALMVIAFAFVMEARANREESTPEPAIQVVESEVQVELNELDWVEQMFIPINEFSRPGIKLEQVNAIVIHNIGNPGTTAIQNRNYFANLALTQETKVSSNFIICLDGTIIQCVPVDEIAYASNERNADTLSIEVCHPDETGKFTDESYAAAVRLTAWLCERFGLTSNDIIRHYDVSGKECPRYFVEVEGTWERFKIEVHREMRQS